VNISFITTINTNIGDDFVRKGIKYLLKNNYKNEKINFANIHKLAPITARYGCEWMQNIKLYKTKLDKILPLSLTKDKILEADIVIQSGAPVYWCHSDLGNHCYRNIWYEPIIKRRLSINKKAKFLNIASGTCQKYYSDGTEICQKCLSYIKELSKISSITTLRDSLAKKIFQSIDIKAPVIPCTSIFAIDEYDIKSKDGEYIVVNYMAIAGHYDFGQGIKKEKWELEFKKFYAKVKNHENIVFVCHNKKELDDAFMIDPNAKVFYSDSYLDYMKFYSKAKFGIMNRIHGAFLLASFGKPSVIIGTDSRAKMSSEIGVESAFVNDINSEYLLDKYEVLNKIYQKSKDKFKFLKKKAFDNYMEMLSNLSVPDLS